MRLLRWLIFALVYASGLAELYRRATSSRARILCYHRISEKPGDPLLDVSAPAFDRQLRYLRKRYATVTLHELATRTANREVFPPNSVSITFDDGTSDWLQRALPLLNRHGIPATFFVCTGYLDCNSIPYPNNHKPASAITSPELKELARSPWVNIGGHTVHHPHLSLLTPEEAYKEAMESRTALETMLKVSVDVFAYPFGDALDYTEDTARAVQRAGYRAACSLIERSFSPRDADPYDLPRLVIFDEPLWMFKVRASGILDDTVWWLKKMIKKLYKSGSILGRWQANNIRPYTEHRELDHGSPKVSILIRAHNIARFLPQALLSIQSQNFEDWEALVLDDHSTDNTAESIAPFIAHDARIRLVTNETCLGRAANLNKGLKLAQGKYIAILDGDDIWCDPTKLSRQVDILDRDHNVILVGGGVADVDEGGKRVIRRWLNPWLTDDQIRDRILIENIIPHSSVCYRRQSALALGGYNQSLSFTEDYEFWLRLGLMGRIQKLPEVVCHYRQHTHNVSRQKHKQQLIEALRVTMQYRARYPHALLACVNRLVKLLVSLIPPAPRRSLSRLLRWHETWFKILDTIFTPKSRYSTSHSATREGRFLRAETLELLDRNPEKITPSRASLKNDLSHSNLSSHYRIIRVHNLASLSEHMRQSWDRCTAESDNGSIFQSFAWVSTWWEHFGEGKKLFILTVLNEANEIQALFPGMISYTRWLWKKLRILSFIGTPLNDIGDVPFLPQRADALASIGDYLAKHNDEWDMIRFNELPINAVWLHLLRNQPNFKRHFITPSSNHLLIHKSNNGQSTGPMAHSSKEDLRRKMRKLAKLGSVKITLNHPKHEQHEMLDAFAALQKQRCREVSFASPFRNHRLQRFWHSLIDATPQDGAVRFASLQVDGKVIAVNCHFASSTTISLYLTTFDPLYHQYSPALLLLDEVIRSWQQQPQSRVYDFGRGHEAYKRRFSNADAAHCELTVVLRISAYFYTKKAWTVLKRNFKKIKILVSLVKLLRKRASEAKYAVSTQLLLRKRGNADF